LCPKRMPVMTKVKRHPCDDFLTAAAQAFDCIAAGVPPDCPQPVLNALLENGLIRRSVRVVGRDSLGPVVRHGYIVPAPVYSKWRTFGVHLSDKF
jgi:hypothetical protein